MQIATRNPAEMYGVVSASEVIARGGGRSTNEDLGKIHELMIDRGRAAWPTPCCPSGAS